MAKSIKELKKENGFLKSKCEKSDVTLIELVEEVSSLAFSLMPYTYPSFTVMMINPKKGKNQMPSRLVSKMSYSVLHIL